MSTRLASLASPVTRCVARQDGGYLVVTKRGAGVSTTEIPEGAHVVIRDGQAVRSVR